MMKKLHLSLALTLLLSPVVGNSGQLVELFTSQGCYSCPPADKLLGELIEENPDLVALEFHVDYWDDLHYGAAGVWKDPFSDASYTLRQRLYNSTNLVGKRGVYTPQMIVNGRVAQVGSSERAVRRALQSGEPEIDLTASIEADRLSVDIKGTRNRGTILWLAVFDQLQVTEVTHGENHGKTMVNHHVVRELVPLAQWRGNKTSQTFQLASLSSDVSVTGNTRCAVFLQDESLGDIRGATYCK